MTTVLQYIQDFRETDHWQTMVQTVENSPWHREDNVSVHTEMVIGQYLTRFYDQRTGAQNTIALLALLFHDTGKPAAEEVLEKKDGSGEKYRRYAGHEQDSAVTFTECWLRDPVLRSLVTAEEARQIRWIIEHHLPYGFKDKQKVQALRTSMAATLGDIEETFYDCLRSDAAGRISDDHATKLQNVEDWIAQFKLTETVTNKIDPHMGTCYVLIGPSGSGKSTWRAQHTRASTKVISRDDAYVEFYVQSNGPVKGDSKALYAAAWRYCCIDNEKAYEAFLAEKAKVVFHYAKFGHSDVMVDNTNGGKKARARYIVAARGVGMKVVAVEFWNTFKTLSGRQRIREDKMVPDSSIRTQQFAQTCAWLGSEVDEVIVVPGS